MFVSNLSGVLNGMWGSSVFQVKEQRQSVLQRNSPVGDMLNRLSENMLDAQNQRAELSDRVDRYLAKIDGAAGAESSAVSEMSDGMLRFYQTLFTVSANVSSGMEADLMVYRDQLAAFDQTIRQYQEMLDGKAALPEQMTVEQAQTLLDATWSARETFLREGAEKLNRCTGKNLVDSDKANHMTERIIGKPHGYEDKDAAFWRIDPDAEDIYGEIDRVLTATHGLTENFRKGLSIIASELERRGYTDAPYQAYFDRERAQTEGAGFRWRGIPAFLGFGQGSAPYFRQVYEHIWSDFRENVSGIPQSGAEG